MGRRVGGAVANRLVGFLIAVVLHLLHHGRWLHPPDPAPIDRTMPNQAQRELALSVPRRIAFETGTGQVVMQEVEARIEAVGEGSSRWEEGARNWTAPLPTLGRPPRGWLVILDRYRDRLPIAERTSTAATPRPQGRCIRVIRVIRVIRA